MDMLGAHVSVAGGPHTAFERGAEIGCNSLQIFVKSPNRWRGAKLDDAEVERFVEARRERPQPVIAHAAYLINLGGNTDELVEKSRSGLVDELERCQRLGVDALVVHPGAHMGDGEDEGIERIARSIDYVLSRAEGDGTRLLLENTAGQGSALGYAFDQLAAILRLIDASDRVGVCLDTCHAFAAGHDLTSEEGFAALLDAIEESVGLKRVEALHLNDSKHPLGSRKDRHESIGEGNMGDEAFRRILTAQQFLTVPMVLETPLGDDKLGHARDLERLRSLMP